MLTNEEISLALTDFCKMYPERYAVIVDLQGEIVQNVGLGSLAEYLQNAGSERTIGRWLAGSSYCFDEGTFSLALDNEAFQRVWGQSIRLCL